MDSQMIVNHTSYASIIYDRAYEELRKNGGYVFHGFDDTMYVGGPRGSGISTFILAAAVKTAVRNMYEEYERGMIRTYRLQDSRTLDPNTPINRKMREQVVLVVCNPKEIKYQFDNLKRLERNAHGLTDALRDFLAIVDADNYEPKNSYGYTFFDSINLAANVDRNIYEKVQIVRNRFGQAKLIHW